MDLIYSILNNMYTSFDIQDLISTYFQEYQKVFLMVLLAIALLNCFFGFHLRKLWGILAGMLLGAIASAAVCLYINKTGMIMYIVIIMGAFILGILALLLYKVGLFFLCVILVPYIFGKIFPAQTLDSMILLIILGVITGVLALVRERDVISILTALGGGFGAARVLLLILDHESATVLLLIGLVLSIAGLFVQFQPWRSRSAWNSDEEKVRDRLRHKRRMRRIRKKRRQQELAEQRRTGRKPARKHSSSRKTATEYTPYTTTRPLGHHTEEEQPSVADSIPRFDRGYSDGTADFEPLDSPAVSPSDRRGGNYSPDLSDIRQNISREVQDIYQEQQDMDDRLNRILEQDYRHTAGELSPSMHDSTVVLDRNSGSSAGYENTDFPDETKELK